MAAFTAGSYAELVSKYPHAGGAALYVHRGPNGSPPPKHLHPAQDERFRVLEGALRVRVDGAERELGSGEEIEIPRGAVHQMWNPGSAPARVIWETRPAGRTEQWFRELGGLQASGRSAATGCRRRWPSEYC
jgi:mannose-6-phosphate isomerase-like protein (cupin superfamily)